MTELDISVTCQRSQIFSGIPFGSWFQCDHVSNCQATFSSHPELVSHKQEIHFKYVANVQPDVTSSFKCSLCQAKFGLPEAFTRHVVGRHSDELNQLSEEAGKSNLRPTEPVPAKESIDFKVSIEEMVEPQDEISADESPAPTPDQSDHRSVCKELRIVLERVDEKQTLRSGGGDQASARSNTAKTRYHWLAFPRRKSGDSLSPRIRCRLCGNKYFQHSSNLICHWLRSHAVKMWLACRCQEVCRTYAKYLVHKKTCSAFKMACAYCKENIDSLPELYAHVSTVHSEMIASHELRSTQKRGRRVGSKNSEKRKQFVCKTCNASFNQESSLKSHLLGSHQSDKIFLCQTCHASFARYRNFINHSRSKHNHSQPTIKCSLCLLPCDSLDTFFDHVKSEHPTPALDLQQRTLEPTKDAPKESSNGNNVTVESSNQGKDINSLPWDHDIRQSLKIPANDFACPKCPRRFQSATQTQSHLFFCHSPQNLFQCDHCPKTFETRSHVTGHKAEVGIEGEWKQTFLCSLCKKQFESGNSHFKFMHHITKCHNKELGHLMLGNMGNQIGIEGKSSTVSKAQPEAGSSKTTGSVSFSMQKLLDNKSIQCPKCQNMFSDNWRLQDHLFQEHSPKAFFQCDLCDSRLQYLRQVYLHKLNAHKELTLHNPELKGTYLCGLCKQKFNTSGEKIRRHLLENHPEEVGDTVLDFRGQKRGRGSGSRSSAYLDQTVQRHQNSLDDMVTYNQEKSAPHSTTGNSPLPRLESEKSKKTIPCPKCPNVLFKSNSLAQDHMFLCHTQTALFQCDLCNQRLKNLGNVYTHKYNCHKNETKDRPDLKGSYLCGLCKQGFNTGGEKIRNHLLQNHPQESVGILINFSRAGPRVKIRNEITSNGPDFEDVDTEVFDLASENDTSEDIGECFDDFMAWESNDKNEERNDVKEPITDQGFACPLCNINFSHQSIIDQHNLLLHGSGGSQSGSQSNDHIITNQNENNGYVDIKHEMLT